MHSRPDQILDDIAALPERKALKTSLRGSSKISPAKKRLLIVGYGRHGKDFAGQLIDRISILNYGGSTSWAALPYVARELGVHPQTAWETRHENREFWLDYCNYLRTSDPLFLIKKVLKWNVGMVIGIRELPEIEAARESGIFHRIIWVDASNRLGVQKDPTVKFGPEHCDEVWDNNGTKGEFAYNIVRRIYQLDIPFA